MKRRLFISAIFIALLLPVILCGWLLSSRAGGEWLLQRIASRASARIAWQGFDGSVLGGLRLAAVDIEQDRARVRIEELILDWSPAALWGELIRIERLQIGRIEVQRAETPERESAFLLPDLRLLAWPLGAWRLEVEQLEIGKLVLDGAQSLTLNALQGRLVADRHVLRLDRFEFAGDLGSGTGDLQFAADAQLEGALRWQAPQSLAPLTRLEVELALSQQASQLQGPLRLRAQFGGERNYRLAGQLQIEESGLMLTEAVLERGSAQGGQVRGNLGLNWVQGLEWVTRLRLSALNLSPEIAWSTVIDGDVELRGQGSTSYEGNFDLQSSAAGWQQLGLCSRLAGDAGQVSFREVQAQVLGGAVAGAVDLKWQDVFAGTFDLSARDLDPALLPDGLAGRIDLNANGWFGVDPAQGLQVGGRFLVPRGQLGGRDFDAEVRGEWLGGRDLRLERLQLNGGWGLLQARGDLLRRLELKLDLSDAKGLWPSLAGAGKVDGWLAWTGDWPHGDLEGTLRELAYGDARLQELQLKGHRTAGADGRLELTGVGLYHQKLQLERFSLQAQGTSAAHQLEFETDLDIGSLRVALNGVQAGSAWRGQVTRLDLNAHQAESFTLEKPFLASYADQNLEIGEIRLRGTRGGLLRLEGHWQGVGEDLSLTTEWRDFNLAWLQPWLADVELEGSSSGNGRFHRQSGKPFQSRIHAEYVGQLTYAGKKYALDRVELDFNWLAEGLELRLDLQEGLGGRLSLHAGSAEQPALELPPQGELQLDLQQLPLSLLNPWLPIGGRLNGLLGAEFTGEWHEAGLFGLRGEIRIRQGELVYQGAKREFRLPLEDVRTHLDWQGESLQGEFDLGLAAPDRLAGELRLDLPARWPLARPTSAPLAATVRMELGDLQRFTLLATERIDDLGGRIDGALTLSGSLADPQYAGRLQLVDGRMNIPQLGIWLEQVALQADFDERQIRVESFSLQAGDGTLQGQGQAELNGWKLGGFHAELKGEGMRVVDLPELRMLASPDLVLEGRPDALRLSGRVEIPELQIHNWHPPNRPVQSDDLVFVDDLPGPEPAVTRKLALDLDLVLGERVIVVDRGLDVRLGGRLQLKQASGEAPAARGQIDIREGRYSAYGVKLPITSGRLYFNGGAVDNPVLDIIAEKKIREVRAGVAVGGTARRPEIRLISDPVLEDIDILSYIMLGHPASGASGDFNALSLAAGALLSASDSVSFQQQLADRSGLDVIDVNTGEQGTLETSVVTVGKYLTPELYLSYGRSLSSSGGSQVQLRYSPSRRVDIESQLGEVSGADIYYRFEFD